MWYTCRQRWVSSSPIMIRKRLAALVIGIALFSTLRGFAIQLGDSRSEVIAKYSTPLTADHSKGTAVYRWESWKLEIHYVNDTVRGLTYTKIDPLHDDEIQKILDQNGGRTLWTPVILTGDIVQLWRRTDGAVARRDSQSKRSLILEGGPITARPAFVATPWPVSQSSTVSTLNGALITNSPSRPLPAASPSAHSLISAPSFASKQSIAGVVFLAGIVLGLKMILDTIGKKGKPKRETRRSQPEKRVSRPEDNTSIEERGTPPPRPPTLNSTSGHDLELIIGEVYRRRGYQVEISSGLGPDGGIDLRLRQDGALVLVQCKHWKVYKVGPEKIREFYGVLKAENAQRGIFVNTGVYTQDARRFAEGKEIELLNGDDVKALIAAVSRPGENIYDIKTWIEEFRTNSLITNPDCPYCHGKMALRSGTGPYFWGCVSYPKCKGKRDARIELLGNLIYQPR